MSKRAETKAEQWEQWRVLLNDYAEKREKPLRVVTFRRAWRSKAQPVLVNCEDGNEYVIKGRQAGRQIVNDQIVARLGEAMGAPVGQPRLVEVSVELVEIEKRLAHIPSGIAHGTKFIPDCFDSHELIATDQPDNRPRLARLAVLFGWITPNDWQFLFTTKPPRLIHSVDHGHFFPDGPDWTEQQLLAAPHAELASCFSPCYLTSDEIQEALQALKTVTESKIIQAVASPPDQWSLTMGERVALVEYLTRRKQELLTGDLLIESQ